MKNLNVCILLDRSGSMSSRWVEALSSIDAYVEKLSTSDVSATVNLATFDTDENGACVELVRVGLTPKTWGKLSDDKSLTPRGGTPLYDAIGKIITFARKENNPKTVIVVLTDGQENSSREYNKTTAKDLIKDVEKNGWEVIFLGADFDVMTESAKIGGSFDKSMFMGRGNYEGAMGSLGAKTVLYATQNTTISFSDADRAEATKKDIKL